MYLRLVFKLKFVHYSPEEKKLMSEEVRKHLFQISKIGIFIKISHKKEISRVHFKS